MSDPWVLATQQWANQRFGGVAGYVPAPETGLTGWPTMYALTRGLQHLLGITSLSDSFGPGTTAAVTALGNIGPALSHPEKASIINLVTGAMYCKGYNGDNGNLSGQWTSMTTAAGRELRDDIGLPQGDGTLAPKVVRALLTMDPYKLTVGGNSIIRTIQKSLNSRYINRRDFQLVATNGFHSRGGQVALIFGLQYELGLADGVANGSFGPTTKNQLKAQGLLAPGGIDTSKYFVHLFQAGLNFNGFAVPFDGSFGASTAGQTSSFQTFVALPATGSGDFQTWASLLVSTGDTARSVKGADASKTITPARAATLVSAGYEVVGRYLTNEQRPGALDKNLKIGELNTIFSHGLRVFPIFQEGNTGSSFFNFDRGLEAGARAFNAAAQYGFGQNTAIYFAVDYDALEAEVRSSVVPYFRGVRAAMAQRGNRYRVGIYGARNTCTIVSSLGLASVSFVGDMSTGYSGNLGYPLPANWAFDQIFELFIGTGEGQLDIDKNVVSGRDLGQSSVVPPQTPDRLDIRTPTTQTADIVATAANWLTSNMSIPQQDAAVRQRAAAVEGVLNWDEQLTALARGFRMRKSLIETALMWEYALENVLDLGVDEQVRYTYAAWNSGIPNPPGARWDSSTGPGQVFAATAIDALNWARGRGLTGEPQRDAASRADVWSVWQRLNTSIQFNVEAVALVLLKCASDAGLNVEEALYFDLDDVKAILTRYNGEMSYGERNAGLYDIVEEYNRVAREVL